MTTTKQMDAMIRTLDPVAWAAGEANDALCEVTEYFHSRPEEFVRSSDVLFARGHLLRREFDQALALMVALRPWFDARSDYDDGPSGYVNNAELDALVALDRAIEQTRRLVSR